MDGFKFIHLILGMVNVPATNFQNPIDHLKNT